jgi:uncharacterized membrane protein (UPF0127 family)
MFQGVMGNNLGVQGFELIPVSRLNMGIPDKSRLVIRAGDQRIADQVIYCNSRDSRRKGLLGRRILASDEGILMKIPGFRKGKSGVVNSIHMLGMRFDIAAAWLDYEGRIQYSILAKRWRPYYGTPHPSWYVLELHSSKLPLLSEGTLLSWKACSPNGI